MKNKTAQPSAKLGLVYDFNALTVLDEQHGINAFDKKGLDKVAVSPSVVRKLVHAGLLHKHPNLTLEEAGKKITVANIGAITDEIQDALTKFFSGK